MDSSSPARISWLTIQGIDGGSSAAPPTRWNSSQPGVFVAGDLRHGSIKRIASAVGEGAMAIALIRRYLDLGKDR